MTRTLRALLPEGSGRAVLAHLALTMIGLVLRAAAAVTLLPFMRALFGPAPGDAWPWLGLLTALTVVGWLVDGAAARRGMDLGFGLLSSGQVRIAERIARVRPEWFTADNLSTARQAVAATGPDLVGVVVYLVVPLLSAVVLPALIGVALVPIAWPLGLVALAGVPVLLGGFALAGRWGRNADRAAADAHATLTERVLEFGRTQQALRAARRTGAARSHVGEALAAQHGTVRRTILGQLPGQLVLGVTTQLVLLALVGTTVLLTVRGALGTAEAVAMIVVVVRYLEPFSALGEIAGGLGTAEVALRRIGAVLDAPTVREGDGAAGPVRPPRIELVGVSAAYDGTPVVERLDLTLEPGSTTAVVGPSGSGKSTILALLAGLREPTAGVVLLDGVPLEELSAEARRAAVSMVFQHPYLFDGPIRDNVLAGAPDAGPEMLAQVGHLARLGPVLDRSPDGWDARVGEGGGMLSGGEGQRVSIARALLKPAPVLLVDEATSALDAENERAVAEVLTADPVPRTRVVVAHRLSSIRDADRVLFLEEGRVVEDGTVEELLAAGGRFADFWRRQDAADQWRLAGRGTEGEPERAAEMAPEGAVEGDEPGLR